MVNRNLYSALHLDQPHCLALKKAIGTSDKSTHVLLGMMVRKNKNAALDINAYSIAYKIKHTRPKPISRPKALSTCRPLDKLGEKQIRMNVQNRQLVLTPRKRVHLQKPIKTHTKLSIIEFPTYAIELNLQSSKKIYSESLVKKQLFNFMSAGNTEDCTPTPEVIGDPYFLTPQQKLLVEFGGEKENSRPLGIRVRTFKSFHQFESLKTQNQRHNYLKPIPVQKFFTKLQQDFSARSELVHSRLPMRRVNFG